MNDPRLGWLDFILRWWYGPCQEECRGFKCIHRHGHKGNCHGVLVWDAPLQHRLEKAKALLTTAVELKTRLAAEEAKFEGLKQSFLRDLEEL